MGDWLWKLEEIGLMGDPLPRLSVPSLNIPMGATALLGPSGAGKTSLLNLLVEFETSDRGRIESRPSEIGFDLPLFWVPQSGGLWPMLTVREHLTIVLSASSERSDRGEPIDAMLSNMGLGTKASVLPKELSMGERSRLAVARALLANPSVLVMDEPLAHLNPSMARLVRELIREHLERTGASLVWATHRPDMVLELAGHVVCLKDGAVTFAGTVDELYFHPPTEELAQTLGEATWFSRAEVALWLGDNAAPCGCIRPENVTLAPAENSPLRVKTSRRRGAVTETLLEHVPSRRVKRVVHLSSNVVPGVRVVVTPR